MRLKDSIVVITGAAHGLGRALAVACASAGAKIVMSDFDDMALSKTADELSVLSVPADVTKEEDVHSLAKKTLDHFGRIDIWINNAGIGIPHTKFEDLSMADLHKLMDVNFFGLAYGSQVAYKQMLTQKSGAIINIVSVRALDEFLKQGTTAYGASKSAAHGFTNILRLEAEGNGIFVGGVYHTRTKTNFHNTQKPEDYDTFMEPSFVADAIVHNILQNSPVKELIVTDGLHT